MDNSIHWQPYFDPKISTLNAGGYVPDEIDSWKLKYQIIYRLIAGVRQFALIKDNDENQILYGFCPVTENNWYLLKDFAHLYHYRLSRGEIVDTKNN